jgi:type IX secretion system PorP/SprF family membrane protein
LKKLITYLFFIFLAADCGAQQLTHYTYFTYNYLNYNPAVVGTTPCLELRVGYRRQWTGIKDAPSTSFASAHGKFRQKGFNFNGLGIAMENDRSGPFSYTQCQLMYARHMRMARKYQLSFGLGVGFTQYRVNFADMTLEYQNIDPVITNTLNDFIFPQFSGGLWLYRSDKFYGISWRNIGGPKVRDLGDTRLKRHATITYGTALKMSDELVFKPAVLFNYVGKSKISMDVQAILEYKKKASFGIGARSGSGLAGIIKLNVIKYMTIAYSYDLTLTKIKYQASASHEIIIGMRACAEAERYHVPCSAYD